MQGHQQAEGMEGCLSEDELRTVGTFSLEKEKIRGLTHDLPARGSRPLSRGKAVHLSGAGREGDGQQSETESREVAAGHG